MADEQEYEEFEELEDTPAGSDAGDDEGTDDQEGADRAPVNRWESRRSLSELLDDDEDTPAGAERAHPAAERDDEDEDDDEDEEEEGKSKGAPAPKDPATEGEEQTRPRFRVVDPEGKPVPFELPKGARMLFPGDGREVAVENVNDLVQLAQKGAGFDTVKSRLEQRVTEERAGREEDQQTAEALAVAMLYGQTVLEDDPENPGQKIERHLSPKEVRERLRPIFKKYLDPEYRAGQKALAEKAEQTAAQQREHQERIEGARTEFWQSVGQKIAAALPELPALTRDDAQEITARFYAGYERTFEQKFAELTAAGVPDARAQEEANKAAFAALSDANLRRVMRGLHAELEPERRTRDAKRHNDTTQRKLRSRQHASKLRGGGASPGIPGKGAARDAAPRAPKTFAERKSAIARGFAALRGEDPDE